MLQGSDIPTGLLNPIEQTLLDPGASAPVVSVKVGAS